MFGFEQFTTEYDPAEDRIRLSGRACGDACATIWLNLRMMRMLVPALGRWLEQRWDGTEQRYSAAIQQFQQVAAAAVCDATPAVPVAPIEGRLAISITYTDLGGAMRLSFMDGAGVCMGWVDLPEVALRQWLTILRGLHRVAKWPEDAFPPWLDVAPSSPEPLN